MKRHNFLRKRVLRLSEFAWGGKDSSDIIPKSKHIVETEILRQAQDDTETRGLYTKDYAVSTGVFSIGV